jgi:repressor of nif and glnA expression
MKKDKDSESILKIIKESKDPLETKEIGEKIKNITRTMIFYRLNNLRGEGQIKGKQVGSGKGTWIWWKNEK